MLRTFGKMMTKMRGMANDFRQQFDEALKEADLDDVRKTLSEAQKLNPDSAIARIFPPTGTPGPRHNPPRPRAIAGRRHDRGGDGRDQRGGDRRDGADVADGSLLAQIALAHPVVTMIVVVVTGNHYWLDGLVCVLAGYVDVKAGEYLLAVDGRVIYSIKDLSLRLVQDGRRVLDVPGAAAAPPGRPGNGTIHRASGPRHASLSSGPKSCPTDYLQGNARVAGSKVAVGGRASCRQSCRGA